MSKDAYSSGLTWERVFNGNLRPWNSIGEVFSAAESTGYAFAAYQGQIYAVHEHSGGSSWLPAFADTSALDEGAAAVAALRATLVKRDVKIEEMARGHARLTRERDEARGTGSVRPLPKAPKKERDEARRRSTLKKPSTQERIAIALAVKAHRDHTLSMADVENAIVDEIETKAEDYQSFEWAPVHAGLERLKALVKERTGS